MEQLVIERRNQLSDLEMYPSRDNANQKLYYGETPRGRGKEKKKKDKLPLCELQPLIVAV